MTTRRRHFLFQAAAVAAAFQLRGPFAFAATTRSKGRPPSRRGLLEALDRAGREGRPLLVIVVPEQVEAMSEWGYRWGEFTGYAEDRQLALLSLVDLYCADWNTIREAVEPARGALSPIAPVACLLETDSRAVRLCDPRWRRVPRWGKSRFLNSYLRNANTTEELRNAMERYQAALAQLPEKREDAIRDQIRVLGEALERVILPDQASLMRRVRQAQSVQAQKANDDAEEQAAAIRWAATAQQPQRHAETLAELRAETRKRMRAPIDGSRWARNRVCSVEIEGEPKSPPVVLCGMGSVSHLSRRFLMFYGGRTW